MPISLSQSSSECKYLLRIYKRIDNVPIFTTTIIVLNVQKSVELIFVEKKSFT